ncbi:hypothetical protein F441_13221 [Phytophthora nicotianae CJ01A1]|uniref:Uncharacterized protein n=2 Tax=Phytophthora nicotianae TaxID=4792 RepID=W2WNW8_PHYNI|nr:hypothetical protein F441_13221 [Phytophthora nicotianae CJ01A1]
MSSVVGGDFDAALCFVDDFMSDGAYGEASPLGLDELSEIPLTQPLSIDMATDQLDQGLEYTQTADALKILRCKSKNRARDQDRRELQYLRDQMADLEEIMCAWQKKQTSEICCGKPTQDRQTPGETTGGSHNDECKLRLKRVQQLTPDQSDMYILKELMASIDSVYRDVDAVFHDNNLDTLESSFDDSEINEGSDGIYMNVIASTVFPFDVASTGAAAWQYFSRSLDHMPFLFLNHKDVQPRAMSPRFALLQTCYLISPALPIRSLSDERSVTGELTDFVLSGTEANVASCHQIIENILFNEAMKAHSKN